MAEAHVIELALGRIFRMAARPERPGDVDDYERCRRIIIDALDPEMATHRATIALQHDAQRDYYKGAQGQA